MLAAESAPVQEMASLSSRASGAARCRSLNDALSCPGWRLPQHAPKARVMCVVVVAFQALKKLLRPFLRPAEGPRPHGGFHLKGELFLLLRVLSWGSWGPRTWFGNLYVWVVWWMSSCLPL